MHPAQMGPVLLDIIKVILCGVITPIEITRSRAVDVRELNPLRRCMADLGLKRGVVIYRGRKRVRLTADVDAIPWDEIRAGGTL